MESTYLYYGKYSQDDRSYQMAVAYFFVIFCCFAFSLVSLVIHSAKYIKQGFKFHEQNSNQYFTLVYCYWDFSVNSETSAKIKSVIIGEILFSSLLTMLHHLTSRDSSTRSGLPFQQTPYRTDFFR